MKRRNEPSSDETTNPANRPRHGQTSEPSTRPDTRVQDPPLEAFPGITAETPTTLAARTFSMNNTSDTNPTLRYVYPTMAGPPAHLHHLCGSGVGTILRCWRCLEYFSPEEGRYARTEADNQLVFFCSPCLDQLIIPTNQ